MKMLLSNYKIKVDVNNINDYQQITAIEHKNDAGVRNVEIGYYSNNNLITFADTAIATAAVVTDGILISESLTCSFNADRTAVIVPIDNSLITAKSGIAAIEVKITEGAQVLTPPYGFKVRVKKSIADDAQVTLDTIGTTAQILQEVAKARGNYDTLDAHIDAKADKATTYTKTEVDNKTTKYIGSNDIDKCDRDDYRYIAYATDLNGYTGYHTVICTPSSTYIRTQYLLSMAGGIQYRSAIRSNTTEAWGTWGAWQKIEGSSSGGTNGKSAYQIAVENGFIGTEQQWLASLKGANGAKGADGKTPVKGTDYFTADDINTIVNAVYAKVADGTEVAY